MSKGDDQVWIAQHLGNNPGAQGMSTKIIQFSHCPTLDLRVVRTPMGQGCSKCAFYSLITGRTCPDAREEKRVAGGDCASAGHHYEVAV